MRETKRYLPYSKEWNERADFEADDAVAEVVGQHQPSLWERKCQWYEDPQKLRGLK